MAFGKAAKTALEAALDAYNSVIRLEAIVDQVSKMYVAHEQRTNDRLAEFERRLREAETRIAALGGRVDGAVADALKVVLLQPEIQRRAADLLASDGKGMKLPPKEAPCE